MEALAEVAGLPADNKLVIKAQTFPLDRAAEAYRVSQGALRHRITDHRGDHRARPSRLDRPGDSHPPPTNRCPRPAARPLGCGPTR